MLKQSESVDQPPAIVGPSAEDATALLSLRGMRGSVAGSLAGIRCLRELRSNYNTPIGREQQDEDEGGRQTDGRTDEADEKSDVAN